MIHEMKGVFLMSYSFGFDADKWAEQFYNEAESLKKHNNTNDDAVFVKDNILGIFEKFKQHELSKLPNDIMIEMFDSDMVTDWDSTISNIDENECIHLVMIVPHVFYDNNIDKVSERIVVFLFLKFSIEVYRCALLSAFSMKYYNGDYISKFTDMGAFVTRDDLNNVEDTGINDGIDFLMSDDNMLDDARDVSDANIEENMDAVFESNNDVDIETGSEDMIKAEIDDIESKREKIQICVYAICGFVVISLIVVGVLMILC